MIYVFDFGLLKGATPNSRIVVETKDGAKVPIHSIGTDNDGNVIITLGGERQ